MMRAITFQRHCRRYTEAVACDCETARLCFTELPTHELRTSQLLTIPPTSFLTTGLLHSLILMHNSFLDHIIRFVHSQLFKKSQKLLVVF
ncbi:hypothetical protein E2C01_065377 [Portunus trituberculatus]|uniref:Uncharacterized protein n=1 Tax=Portunus trituberculatus TaxID=210409 RepID=A0A5B7HQY1_PORTR|nr:hypothetical protein [Portunus trituberculatus]